jgi:hypothetical protein
MELIILHQTVVNVFYFSVSLFYLTFEQKKTAVAKTAV